jgi:hypothetical protein
VTLARLVYDTRDFSPMPILADALQDAGCDSAELLDHCRSDGPHVRGCWAVDLLLGKEQAVTEAVWLAATDPTPMLGYLTHVLRAGRPDGQRDFLLAAAAGRLIWTLFKDERSQLALDWGEAFADDADFPVPWSEVRRGTDAAYSAPAAVDRTGEEFESALVAVLSVSEEDRTAAGAAFQLHRRHGGDPTLGPALIRDIFGNPFRRVTADPSWRTTTALALARGIYAEKAFQRLPILANALQDAGCEDEAVLTHCRGEGPHVRGCWVVDLLLGKE